MESINVAPKQKKTLALWLVISLFFLWALTANLLPSLIPHLKKACQLSDFQSAFIDSSYWIAYFVMAFPAGLIIRKYSYKTGIVAGLLLAMLGALLFYPAAEIRTFGFFLVALFLIAGGMSFLETAANPYVTLLGDPSGASQRLNFAQAFNGLGAFISAYFLSKVILSGKEYTIAQTNAMSPAALQQYLTGESARVKIPYLCIALVLFLVALLFILIKLPKVEEEENKVRFRIDFSVFRHSHFMFGVIAQFFYVGAQVCISSFFIRYCKYSAGMPEITATNYLGYLLLFFMVGRYVGSLIMLKVKPQVLLACFSAANILLLCHIVFIGGKSAVYSMMAVEFFMSIMFPTIFALAIRGLGERAKIASSFLVMSIVGGAILPLLLGYISWQYNIKAAYAVPLVCFFFVFYYGYKGYRIKDGLIGQNYFKTVS